MYGNRLYAHLLGCLNDPARDLPTVCDENLGEGWLLGADGISGVDGAQPHPTQPGHGETLGGVNG